MRIAAEHTFVMLLVLVVPLAAARPQKLYNVIDFRAVGDGKTDDAKAFLETWKAACNDTSWPILVIPSKRTFLLSEVSFRGPCKSPITIQLNGNIVAPNYIWTTKPEGKAELITFYRVDNMIVDGTGQIHGRGANWWNCYNHKRCKSRPILLAFKVCNNLLVRRIHLKNSADKHMTLYGCSQVQVYNVSITAPRDSPNTDGITISHSDHVYVSSCHFQTGDDCVSILSQTTDVNITDSTCGPGHGISVGSLGADGSTAVVERVTVSRCSFFGTMNGVRIKSWQGGKGNANSFLFENISMTAVQNPIIIDQFYCPQHNCPSKDGGVAISDARFINIHGTSSTQQAIKLLCSNSVQCHGIYLNDVNLTWGNHTAPAKATILNAHGTTVGMVIPKVHLSQ